jgi:hypothetical protein
MGRESAETLQKFKNQTHPSQRSSLPFSIAFNAVDKISKQLTSLKTMSASHVTLSEEEQTKFSVLIQSIASKGLQRLSVSTETVSVSVIQDILKRNAKTITKLQLICNETDDVLCDSISVLSSLTQLSLATVSSVDEAKIDLKWLKAVPSSVTHLTLQGKLTERVARHLRTQMAHLTHVELDYAFWNSKFCLIRAKDINLSKMKEVVAENLPSAASTALTSSVAFAAVEAVGLRGAAKLISDLPADLMPQIGYSLSSLMLLRFGQRAWKPILESAETKSIWARPELLDTTGMNLFHLASCSALQDYFVVEKLFSADLLQPSYARDRRCLQDSQCRNPIMLASYVI